MFEEQEPLLKRSRVDDRRLGVDADGQDDGLWGRDRDKRSSSIHIGVDLGS